MLLIVGSSWPRKDQGCDFSRRKERERERETNMEMDIRHRYG